MERYIGSFFPLPGYRYLGDSGIDLREISHDGTYRFQTCFLPHLGRCPQLGIPKMRNLGLDFGHLIANVLKR